jgi:competence protein ComEC
MKPDPHARLFSSFATFPVLGALALIAGILLEVAGAPVVFVVLLLVALAALGFGISRIQRNTGFALMLAVLLIPFGFWRYSSATHQPDPLANLEGRVLEFEGYFDGRVLYTNRGGLSVSPRKDLSPGRWRVKGRLEAINWYRNPGAFDLGAWLSRRGVLHGLRLVSSTRLPGQNILEPARAHLESGVKAKLQPREAAFMNALILGETDDLSSLPDLENDLTWRDVFARSGLSHILALSGQQVTLLVAALGLVLAFLGVWRYPALIGLLVFYTLVTGASPSVTRAALMGVAVLISGWLGRGKLEIMPTIALSAIFALGYSPQWILDLGFQLSYLAVIGMALFLPPVQVWLEKRSKPIRFLGSVFAVTFGAQALTLPLATSSFGLIPLFSPFVNLFAGFLAVVLVPIGFLAAALGAGLGGIVNFITQPFAWLLLELAHIFAYSPALEWGRISSAGMLAYYAVIAAIGLTLYGKLRFQLMLVVLIAAVIVTGLLGKRPHHEIVYFDVHQGDSSLIRLPQGDILIDGGGTPRSDYDIGARAIIPALRSMGVKHLLAIIGTHADSDHIEGVSAILKRVKTDVLILGQDKVYGVDPVLDAVKTAAEFARVPIRIVRRGETWRLGEATIEFLHPGNTMSEDDNTNSVIFTLEYHGRKSLFLGDAPSEIEAQIHPGKLEVLKLAHHGSRFSSSEELLDKTRSSMAIISSGAENTYGHPNAEVLDRVKRHNIRVYRTDRDGAIHYDLETGAIRLERPNDKAGTIGIAGKRPRVRVSTP